MQNKNPAQRYPDWIVWLVFCILSIGLLVFLSLVNRDILNQAYDKQAKERIELFSEVDTIPRVVLIGSSLLRHAVPFDETFDSLFSKKTGKVIKSLRMTRANASINQFISSLTDLIKNPPDIIYIEKSSLFRNKRGRYVSVAQYFRFLVQQLLGLEVNSVKSALSKNTKNDEIVFNRDDNYKLSLTMPPDSATISKKAGLRFQRSIKDKSPFSKDLVRVLKKLAENGTRIRILNIPRIEEMDNHPVFYSFDQQLATELSGSFGSEIFLTNISDRPELTMYCDPSHLNVTGRDFFISQLIPLINQEIYGNSVR